MPSLPMPHSDILSLVIEAAILAARDQVHPFFSLKIQLYSKYGILEPCSITCLYSFSIPPYYPSQSPLLFPFLLLFHLPSLPLFQICKTHRFPRLSLLQSMCISNQPLKCKKEAVCQNEGMGWKAMFPKDTNTTRDMHIPVTLLQP